MVVNEPKPRKNWLRKRGVWYLGEYVGAASPSVYNGKALGTSWRQGRG